jgi:predicted metalloprotease with PDZ domain
MAEAIPDIRVSYTVSIADGRAHLLRVRLKIEHNPQFDHSILHLFIPVWTPGSYMVREHARHVEQLRIVGDKQQDCSLEKIRKNRWQLHTSTSEIELEYLLYAWESSVRANHVNLHHAYWNGSSTYLVVEEAQSFPCTVHIVVPPHWQVATPFCQVFPKTTEPGHWFYHAPCADALLDAPVECGPMKTKIFQYLGREHFLWVYENIFAQTIDWERVEKDSQLLVAETIKLLAGEERDLSAVVPYDSYHFFWQITARGRAGLEHANSCSLLASASSFFTRTGYLEILSLIAHEYLHVWNIKAIRPQGLFPYDYHQENYTRLLWWFEGGTCYFDWRIVYHSGLCSTQDYVDHLSGEISSLLSTPGARVQSLVDASFDAWIKAYRPDENSMNSAISYYLKGEVVCALLDMEIRAATAGKRTIDDVLRYLWQTFGTTSTPVPEHGMAAIFEQATGVDVQHLFRAWIESSAPIAMDATLAKLGLKLHAFPGYNPTALGLRLRKRNQRIYIDQVARDTPAIRAGLEKGDEILAMGGQRLESTSWDTTFVQGIPSEIVYVRDGHVRRCMLIPGPPVPDHYRLELLENASPEQCERLREWLRPDAVEVLSKSQNPPASAH